MEDIMNRLMKKLEDIMVAVTFAEAGEYDEAGKMASSDSHKEMNQPLEGFNQAALENAGK
jgi:hypothetical protein